MRIFRHLLSIFFAAVLLALPVTSRAAVEVAITATIAPPPLPVYAQPIIPGPGYIWIPGYWAWAPGGYYWVPGTWSLPPAVGLLWTPGYWGWVNGAYLWHGGYWGPHVGFYGGINYGFGYIGAGYFGGFWDHDHFHYNQAVNNFGGTHITNVYNQTVVNNVNITRNANITRTSFNGGNGGINAQPNANELQAAQEHHVGPTNLQAQHEQRAAGNHANFASANHGRPPIAATPRPAAFTSPGVVGAHNNGPQHNAGPAGQPHQGQPHQAQQHQAQAHQQHPQQAASHQPHGPGGNGPHGPMHQAASQGPHPQAHPGGQQHGGGHDEHGGGDDHGHGPH